MDYSAYIMLGIALVAILLIAGASDLFSVWIERVKRKPTQDQKQMQAKLDQTRDELNAFALSLEQRVDSIEHRHERVEPPSPVAQEEEEQQKRIGR
jgi:hypothetical protein